MVKPKLCVLCEDRPRVYRVVCGHMFACKVCIHNVGRCIYCQRMLAGTKAYNGVMWYADDDVDTSGNETFDPEWENF